MRFFISLTLLVCILQSSVIAANRRLYDTISYATVGINLSLDTIRSFKSDEKSKAIKKQLIRIGLTIATSEILKRVIHEERPDGSDNLSFPSEHTALSCVSLNWRNPSRKLFWEAPTAFGTAAGRVGAKKHHIYDVTAGCEIGLVYGYIR